MKNLILALSLISCANIGMGVDFVACPPAKKVSVIDPFRMFLKYQILITNRENRTQVPYCIYGNPAAPIQKALFNPRTGERIRNAAPYRGRWETRRMPAINPHENIRVCDIHEDARMTEEQREKASEACEVRVED